jgi:hypothetical protein
MDVPINLSLPSLPPFPTLHAGTVERKVTGPTCAASPRSKLLPNQEETEGVATPKIKVTKKSCVIGSLRNHIEAWREMGADPLICKAIEEGVWGYWEEGQEDVFIDAPGNNVKDPEQVLWITKEVARL